MNRLSFVQRCLAALGVGSVASGLIPPKALASSSSVPPAPPITSGYASWDPANAEITFVMTNTTSGEITWIELP